jgi:hypothetical protein
MYIVYNSKNEMVLLATRKEDTQAFNVPDEAGQKYRIEEVTSKAIQDRILKECTGS